ncbi:MAG: WD40 repeat protein [Kiritimatiellia bacterium]|jgi:WD40 repeat protein
MNEVVPYSYTQLGNLIVLGDGPELLVYSGSNDQGMWKIMAEDIVMGVGSTKDHVYMVDGSGLLVLYRAINGEELSRLRTDCSPWSMEVAADGSVAILTANSVVIVRGGADPLTVPLSGPRKAAWDTDATKLAVACNDGSVYVLDPSSGAAMQSVGVGEAVTAVRWRVQGHWVVSHGRSVSYLGVVGEEEPVLSVTETMVVGGATVDIAVSSDGSVLAVALDDQRVQIFEMLGKVEAGFVQFARTIYAVRFGNHGWLGVGFDDGDANRFDVITGKMTRTQAHVGRGQNAWKMKPEMNHAVVRGAMATTSAGGSPIAKHNVPKIKKKKKKRSKWMYVGGCSLVLFILCCGGGGVVGAWQYGLF